MVSTVMNMQLLHVFNVSGFVVIICTYLSTVGTVLLIHNLTFAHSVPCE